MNWLRLIAEYDRPWIGRVGLALILVLWLFLTVVGFAVGVTTGLAFLIVGGGLVAGEAWIERSGGQHATFVLVWRLSWRIGTGVAVIVIAAINSGGWNVALAVIFAGWLILSGLFVARLRWLETHGGSARRDA